MRVFLIALLAAISYAQTAEDCMDVDDVQSVLNGGQPTGRTCASAWDIVSEVFDSCPDEFAEQCPQTCNVTCPAETTSAVLEGNCTSTLDPCQCSGNGCGWDSDVNKCVNGSTTSCGECAVAHENCTVGDCEQFGCPAEYNPDLVCQCNPLCLQFGNCCKDAVEVCQIITQEETNDFETLEIVLTSVLCVSAMSLALCMLLNQYYCTHLGAFSVIWQAAKSVWYIIANVADFVFDILSFVEMNDNPNTPKELLIAYITFFSVTVLIFVASLPLFYSFIMDVCRRQRIKMRQKLSADNYYKWLDDRTQKYQFVLFAQLIFEDIPLFVIKLYYVVFIVNDSCASAGSIFSSNDWQITVSLVMNIAFISVGAVSSSDLFQSELDILDKILRRKKAVELTSAIVSTLRNQDPAQLRNEQFVTTHVRQCL